jgi:hypothetical protein
MQIRETADILEDAQARVRAKRAVMRALEQLDENDQRHVLADLLADLTPEPAVRKPAVKAAKKPARARQDAPARRRARKPGRPAGTSGGAGPTKMLLAFLRDNPRAPIGMVARAIYGADDETAQNKTRSLMNAQKKRGMVRRVAPGAWEAVTAA